MGCSAKEEDILCDCYQLQYIYLEYIYIIGQVPQLSFRQVDCVEIKRKRRQSKLIKFRFSVMTFFNLQFFVQSWVVNTLRLKICFVLLLIYFVDRQFRLVIKLSKNSRDKKLFLNFMRACKNSRTTFLDQCMFIVHLFVMKYFFSFHEYFFKTLRVDRVPRSKTFLGPIGRQRLN